MATAKDAYKRRKYGILTDIIDESFSKKADSDSDESIFYVYKDKQLIGNEIFKELYARYDIKQKGFYMDDSKTIGVLSQCQSLLALMLLASDFNQSFDEKHIIDKDEENLTIREIMDEVIDDVVERLKTKEKGVYLFDASPYDTNHFKKENISNIETITWVVMAFLQVLRYHAEQHETCKWQDDLVDIIRYGIEYINKGFINPKQKDIKDPDKLNIGWNFTERCQEPSLFYSFAVCECYVEFFETFGEYLGYCEGERYNTLTKADKAKIEEHNKSYERDLKKDDPGYNEQGKKIAPFDTYNELRMRFIEINGGKSSIADSTLYGTFEKYCKMVANDVWDLTKDHLADRFFYNDLKTTLSEEDISISTTSDALFNTVYIINIMLDAGIDEDLQRKKENAIDEDDIAEAEREYENFFEACQLASQKAFRMYDKLKNDGKEYIVEQFLVGFNEKFTDHKDLVKELRKLRMRVFTLMPLLIRTNNAISEYLIKYPQVNMKKYLGYILENRYEVRNKFKWVWENDGYFSCSNYYYVSALGEFYRYYDEYEKKYIDKYTENETGKAEIIENYTRELEAPGGAIDDLRIIIREKEADVKKLTEKLENIETPIEDSIKELIEKEMRQLLPSMLTTFLSQTAKGLTVSEIDPTEENDEQKLFMATVLELLFGIMSKYIYIEAGSGRRGVEEKRIEYDKIKSWIDTKLKEDLHMYVSNIKNSQGLSSELFAKIKEN